MFDLTTDFADYKNNNIKYLDLVIPKKICQFFRGPKSYGLRYFCADVHCYKIQILENFRKRQSQR